MLPQVGSAFIQVSQASLYQTERRPLRRLWVLNQDGKTRPPKTYQLSRPAITGRWVMVLPERPAASNAFSLIRLFAGMGSL